MEKKDYDVFIQRLAEAKTPVEVDAVVRDCVNVWRTGNTRYITRKSAVKAGTEGMLPAARNMVGEIAGFSVVPSIELPKLVYKVSVKMEKAEE